LYYFFNHAHNSKPAIPPKKESIRNYLRPAEQYFGKSLYDGELTLACLTILSNMVVLMSFDEDDVGAGGLRSSQVETVYI
jgi:hypothetical protein